MRVYISCGSGRPHQPKRTEKNPYAFIAQHTCATLASFKFAPLTPRYLVCVCIPISNSGPPAGPTAARAHTPQCVRGATERTRASAAAERSAAQRSSASVRTRYSRLVRQDVRMRRACEVGSLDVHVALVVCQSFPSPVVVWPIYRDAEI